MTRPTVRVWAEGRPGQIGLFTWLHLTLVEGLPDVEQRNWQTPVEDLRALVEDADQVVSRTRSNSSDEVVARMGACVVHLGLVSGSVLCQAAGPDGDAVAKAIARTRTLIPERVVDNGLSRVPLTVWHCRGDVGGTQRSQEIEVPNWEEIAENYAAPTRRALEPLMEEMEPGKGGQLILWHGPPGTGKTYAIRALAWEWRAWADFHYVSDPDVLFGQQPSYLFEVVLDAPKARARTSGRDRWTVVVLEDMGEILAPDARMQMGQGLSRVLNLVDGLLGQGLRLLVLVTTNEPLDRVHPAVARPGRCAARVEFSALEPHEVEAWFAARGSDVPGELAGVPATIASLHAALDGRTPELSRAVGFLS